VNAPEDPFDRSRACFAELVGWLEGTEAAALSHADLEDQLDRRGRELLRQMFQGQLDLRALGEQRAAEVTDAEGVRHGAVETGHRRPLSTIFGAVGVTRLAYRHRGHANLYPADGQLNLPVERHSHGLRRLAAVEGTRGSFDEATEAIRRATSQSVGKRQVEALTCRAAADVEDFYATRQPEPTGSDDVLVISADGKGIVMRPEALRPQTARNAKVAIHKLTTRLSKGEKRNRKRLAEVGAVYDVTPVPRSAADVIGRHHTDKPPAPAPVAKNKWLTASVVDDAKQVLATVFDQAERRDPDHRRRWIALVDGNNHQIDRIHAEATARGIDVTVLLDLVHVLEYLSAPRGAPLYPPLSGERLEEISLGPMAYLDAKEKGDSSMLGNRRPSSGIWGGVPGDPRDMAKAGLPEVQSPEGAIRTPAGKMPETGAALCGRVHRYLTQPPGSGAMPNQGIQGDEWTA